MNREEFQTLRGNAAKTRKDLFASKTVIQVVLDGGSIPSGAKTTLAKFKQLLADSGRSDIEIHQTSSFGAMWMEPTIFISKPGAPRIVYGEVDADRAATLWQRYVLDNDPCPELAFAWMDWTHTYPDYMWAKGPNQEAYKAIPHIGQTDWGRLQQRIVLRHTGDIDPESIEDFMAVGATKPLTKLCTA